MRERRIVGGQLAEEHEFPWQVFVRRSFPNEPYAAGNCSGSIVDRSWILTAAHCAEDL